MGKVDDTPEVPDVNEYIDLAREQGAIGRELIQEQTRANRPDQFTPSGSSVWTELGGGRWRQDVNLPKDVQAGLESQQRIVRGRSEMGEDLLSRVGDDIGAPIDWDALDANEVMTSSDARDRAEDALYGRATSRLDPYWEQQQEQAYTRLWNQGLRPGDEAWDTAMGNLERARTDAYQAARDQAIAGGGVEAERDFRMDMDRRQQAIVESLRKRGTTINEINALLSGSQVGMPELPGFQASRAAQAPDLLGAAQQGSQNAIDDYNAQQMRDQGLMAGISNLGSAAALGYFAFSDRRLKRNIRRVGSTPAGQPVYRYTIFGRSEIGVMADETPPALVRVHPSGYLMVDYSRVR